ncbi:unnamed protein product [Discula destructiva]
MPRTNLLLLTGATGHVGFRTLVHALRAGLEVRVTVRSESKAVLLLSRIASKFPHLNLGLTPTYHSSSSLRRSKLTFALIPDMTLDRAYDEAMEDITHVIHVASPLVTGSQYPPIDCDQAEDFYIRPAVRGTVNLLEAADRCGTVQRVVITSSIAALLPVAQMEGTEIRPPNTPVRPTDRVPFIPGPYHSEFAAYANSKIAALEAAERWHERACPAFDMIHLHPSFVLGRNDMATTPADCLNGTNAMVLAMLLGRKYGPFVGASIHVDDVARCHLAAAMETKNVPGKASYILSQASRWNDAKKMAARFFPKAMKTRSLVATGCCETTEMDFDTDLTLDTFDVAFQGFEAQVQSLCAQFLKLRSPRGNQDRTGTTISTFREKTVFSRSVRT